jgi:transcriptional regulator with XRE-family HTH domain
MTAAFYQCSVDMLYDHIPEPVVEAGDPQEKGYMVPARLHAAERTFHDRAGQSLAAAAGISQGYLSQLAADEREPTLSIAANLARALGISLDELATGAR